MSDFPPAPRLKAGECVAMLTGEQRGGYGCSAVDGDDIQRINRLSLAPGSYSTGMSLGRGVHKVNPSHLAWEKLS